MYMYSVIIVNQLPWKGKVPTIVNEQLALWLWVSGLLHGDTEVWASLNGHLAEGYFYEVMICFDSALKCNLAAFAS